MHYGDTTVNTESVSDLFIEVVEMSFVFVAQLGYSDYVVFVSYREAQDVASFESGSFVHAFVEKGMFVSILYIEQLSRGSYMT